MSAKERWLLFDWGDTLMRVFPEYSGPMSTWPRVAALAGAQAALQALRGRWRTALATNAADSDPASIRQALQRAGLDELLDRIFCYRSLGFMKPAPQFFMKILSDLQAGPGQVVMVGDNFEVDVLGANRSGLRAVWLNERSDELRSSEMYRTVHSLAELPEALEGFELEALDEAE